MIVAKWIDTRPERPANPYVVMGVEFIGGVAELARPVSANAAATFAALGIIPAPTGPNAPEAVEAAEPELEAVETVDVVTPAPAAPARATKPKPKG